MNGAHALRTIIRRSVGPFAIFACLLACIPLIGAPAVHATAPTARGAALSLANGALIRDASNGRVYLIWSGRRHWIDSPQTFALLGYAYQSVQDAAPSTVAAIPDGTVLGTHTVAGGLVYPLSPIISDPVKLSVAQPDIAPGSVLHLYGAGFAANEPITLTAPNNLSFTISADGGGTFAVDVPIASGVGGGLHHVYVQGTASGRFGVAVFYVVGSTGQPTATVAPNPVMPGGSLSVSGTGFGAGERVEVFVYGGATTGVAAASSAGTFGPLSIAVPAGVTSGSVVVRAYGTSTHRYTEVAVTVAQAQPTAVATATATATATPPAPTATMAPATVVPLVGVNPPTVSSGARTIVSGSGFVPSEQVIVRLNGMLEASITADPGGNFGGLLLTIPFGLTPGGYTVTATGVSSNRTGSASLAVQASQPVAPASISVSPSSAYPGGRIQVSGTGYTPGEAIVVNFNNAQVATLTADAGGSFSNVGYVVPGTAVPGNYPISVNGLSSGRAATAVLAIAASPQVITARFYVSPGTVTSGTRVSFAGSGFGGGEVIVIRLSGNPIANVTASPSGTFSGTLVPRAPLGTYAFSAAGVASGRTAVATLRVVVPVTPGIGLVPNVVHRGAVARVNGNNFLGGEIVLIRFRSQLVQAVQTDRFGRFANARFVVPGNAPYGASSVSITGARSGRSAHATIYVTPAPPAGPRISVSSKALHRNATLTVAGHGFLGGETLLVRFRGQLVQAAIASGAGTFSRVSFRIPVNTPFGNATVTVTGGRSGRSASATIRVTAPSGPAISLLPGEIGRGGRSYVSGYGFAGGEIILIRVNGTLVQAGQADSHGAFGHVAFTVPHRFHKGIVQVEVTGGRSNRKARAFLVIA